MKNKKLRKGIKTAVGKAQSMLILLLCMLLCVPAFMPVVGAISEYSAPVYPTEPPPKGYSLQKTYLLSVSTGAVPGDSVKYFEVKYRDLNNTIRTATIFPHNNNGLGTYKPADNYSSVRDQAEYYFNYYVPDADACTMHLQPNSTDSFLFTVFYDIKSVIGINFFMEYSADTKNAWTCVDISLFRVNSLYGTEMMGYYSADYFIDFDGELIAKFVKLQNNGGDFSLYTNDEMFSVVPDNKIKYQLKTEFPESEKRYLSKDQCTELVFRLDISDLYEASMLAYSNEYRDRKSLLRNMDLCEALNICFTYEDTLGGYRTTNIPFFISCALWAMNTCSDLASKPVIGLAQQGDTLLFVGKFPGFKTLKSYQMTFGRGAEDKANLTLDYSETEHPRKAERHRMLEDPETSLYFSGLSVFNADTAQARAYVDGAMLRCSTSGTPLYYFRSKSTMGQVMSSGNIREMSQDFVQVKDGDTRAVTLLPKISSGWYVVELDTDSIESASTTEKIKLKFKYMSRNGVEKYTDEYDLSTECETFYGYWSMTGSGMLYDSGTQKGGKLLFGLNYTDVAYFESCEISIPSEATDEWQMSRLVIYSINSLPQRNAEWLEHNWTVNDCSTDRRIYRDYSTYDIVQSYDKKLLLSHDINSVTIEFEGTSGGKIEENDVNWEQIKDSMTYNEAVQNLRFTKVRNQYQVWVKVYSNTNASDIYGDCGSTNKFYFKLIFDGGSSAYVQANQQLSSDGFRAGEIETFYISTNRDYGEITAIRIIPDDMLEGNDVYDKLNIESIEVVKVSTGGVSASWRFDNVGWIKIDFQDDGAQNSVNGQKLRSEFEIAKTFSRTGSGVTMSFLVAITTGKYTNGGQLEGSVTATVTYRCSNGTTQTPTFDVVEAIATYAGKTCVRNDSINNEGKKLGLIDKKYMFREDSTDRFVISLDDVEEIYSITLHITSMVDTRWQVDSLDVYSIIDDGALFINEKDEYQRDGQIKPVCSDTSANGYQILVYSSKDSGTISQNQPIELTENKITVDKVDGNVVIDRLPKNDDDFLNLYVYFDNSTKVSSVKGLTAAVQYQKREIDSPYQINAKDLIPVAEKNMMYCLGLNAKGMTSLIRLGFKTSEEALVRYAILQQVRSGVVVKTYFLNYGKADTQYGAYSTPEASSGLQYDEQILSLQFSNETRTTGLISDAPEGENVDIAVALTYTTTNDAAEVLYTSPYIYLTDQQIRQIHGGQVVDIKFNESYFKDLKSIVVVGIGEVSATIEKAMLDAYVSGTGGISEKMGHFSIDRSIPVTRTVTRGEITDNAVEPFEFTVLTNASLVESAGEDFKVMMTIGVSDEYGTPAQITLNDISGYVAEGSFAPGSSARIRLLLSEVSDVGTVRIAPVPTSAGGTAEWYVSSVSLKWNCNGETKTVSSNVNRILKQDDGYMLNTSPISISLNCKVYDADGTVCKDRNTISGNDLELELAKGQYITFDPTVYGSLPGYGCKMTAEVIGASFDIEFSENGGIYTFIPPEFGRYKIVVSSEEKETVNIIISLNVA